MLKKYPRLSETFILDEILALEAAGVEVSVFSLRQPDDARFHSDLADVGAEVTYLPAFGSAATMAAFGTLDRLRGSTPGGLGRALRFLERVPAERRAPLLVQGLALAESARERSLDHLHAHFMTVAAHTALLAHVFTGVPFTVTAHAKDLYRDSVDVERFRTVAEASAGLITVCEANRDYLRERFGLPPEAVEVIRNGLRLEALPRPVAGPRRPLVLGVGRLVEKKGFHLLVEACAVLAGRGVDFECVVAGEGEERDRLARLVADLRLEDRVRLIGAADRGRIFGLLQEAALVAAPCVVGADGNRDALPTVLIEALAMGVPVVSTPIGGIPEIVEPGVEGLLVPAGDAGALADAIERLLRDPRLRSAMGSAGPRKAAARFDRSRNARRMMEIFEGAGRPGLHPVRALP